MKQDFQKGFMILIATITVLVIVTVITVSMLYISTSATQSNQIVEQSTQARYLADACIERALVEIKIDADYAGDENIDFETNSCEILPMTLIGSEYQIRTSGIVGDVVRKLNVTATRDGGDGYMSIVSWTEVADF
jgi:Tfp pilus assembly protein PilX